MASSEPDDIKEILEATQALLSAVMDGDEAGVRLALTRGGRPEVTVPGGGGESVCLVTVAATRGHDHLLPVLLQERLSIEGGGTADTTPLMQAAIKGHTETVKALLTHGTNPLATDSDGKTALFVAALYGQQHCVATLIPVSPPTPAHLEALTPLHAASDGGHVEVLEQLVSAGWPLHARDSDGDTPLHFAARNEHVAAVQRLVELGGDMRLRNKEGHTPLDTVRLLRHLLC